VDAHGAAGIAYALPRWQERYPHGRTVNAISLALEYENRCIRRKMERAGCALEWVPVSAMRVLLVLRCARNRP
jgi:hypothetical protein